MQILATEPSLEEGPAPAERGNGFAFGEAESRDVALAHCNRLFESLNAEDRVAWADSLGE